MRLVITGGTGLIGRALSANLAADGHEVIVLSRFPERAKGLAAGVRPVRWDGRTAEGWMHLADGADAIVNLAGANIAGTGFFPSRWTEERKREIQESRIHAGQAVVEAVIQASRAPEVVIQASGVGYYGPHGDEELDEDASPGDDLFGRLAHEYWEPSTEAVERLGVRRVIVRSGVVLDAREGALPRLLLPFRLFVGGPIGSGRQWLSWIHREDEVRAIRFLIENQGASGPVNLCAPNPVTYRQLAHILGRVMGRPSWIPLPGFAMKLAFGEVSSVLLEGQKAIPLRLQEAGFVFCFPDMEGALRDVLG
jgi:uncharacterized protein (TIGR01777 family)